MTRRYRTSLLAAAAIAAIAVVPALAQEHVPTKDNPIRYTAFAVNMQGGLAGQVDIVIERWSTDAEREQLIKLVQASTDRPHGQDKLLDGLQDIKGRTGFIRTPNRIGWDLKYAHQNPLPDGGRQIVIATDKPVSFFAARNQTRTMDYPFTLVEMRFPAGSLEGEGKLLAQTSIVVKEGKIEIEIYGQEPTRLTKITQAKSKAKTE